MEIPYKEKITNEHLHEGRVYYAPRKKRFIASVKFDARAKRGEQPHTLKKSLLIVKLRSFQSAAIEINL